MHGAGLALLLLLPSLRVHAHDVHQTRAEAEYNATTQRLEVSLTVFVDDLELALTRQTERLMSITSTPAPELDSQLQRYLSTNFVVTDGSGKSAALHWVGRQLDPATIATAEPEVTLFFELSLPDGLKGCNLRHIVFCDRFKDQSNLLHLRHGAQSTELRFSPDEPVHELAPVR